jgi:polysaccharide export outer membrane protein
MVALLITITSCVDLKQVTLMQQKSVSSYSQEIVNKRQTEYLINSGDHLYIKIYSADAKTSKLFQSDFPELMNSSYIYLNSYKVDEAGNVNYSFVGKIMVKGLTIPQAQEVVKNTLGEYFKDINVFIKLVNFNVTVLGEVKSPGTFTIDKEQFSIFQALGMAGGFTDYGKVKKVSLIRKSPNGSIVKELDMTDNGLLASEYYFLMPDDVIYVSPRSTKPFVFDKFPYGIGFGILSIGLSIYAITK